MINRKFFLFLTALALLLISGYMGIGYFLYDTLADIDGRCGNHRLNRPDLFTDVRDYWEDYDFDPEPYYMPVYEEVTFDSREDGITISGWYVEQELNAPTVIVVHGLGSCKFSVTALAPAGMLARNGFNVLLIDVRDAGDSSWEDGRSAIGNEEYLDVLGAFDWLVREKSIPPSQIGLFGNSMGAATSLIAFTQEPAVGAVFVDSPFDNLPQIIQEELAREGYPQFLFRSGILMASLTSGDQLLAFNPNEALEKANGRPIFIVHGTGDQRIGVHHSLQLQEKAEMLDAPAEVWIVDGVDHVRALVAFPDEYERRVVEFFSNALKNNQ